MDLRVEVIQVDDAEVQTPCHSNNSFASESLSIVYNAQFSVIYTTLKAARAQLNSKL
jgi:hypothetical protein